MTDYITIGGVRKRNFTVPVTLPNVSETQVNVENYTGEPILWDDTTDIHWDDGTQIFWSTYADVYPRVVQNIRKRSFVINAKKR